MDNEILDEFKAESKQLLNELNTLLSEIENSQDKFPAGQIDQFALKIDRIMGAAKTLAMLDPDHKGLVRIGQIALICKNTGYKALAKKNIKIIPIFSAFWFEAIETVENLVAAIEDQTLTNKISAESEDVLSKRLDWLSKKAA